MARKKRGRRGYATDLTDGQWALGQGQGQHRRRDRQTRSSRQGLRGAAPPLGGRAHLRLDRQEPLVVRDYEQLTAVAETLITIAATATLMRLWP